MKPHNLSKILLASIMLSTGLHTIAMEDASECVELDTFRASGISNDPHHIVNTFLHNQPMYQRTFATLLQSTSQRLAAHTLREIPLAPWALKKLSLPKLDFNTFPNLLTHYQKLPQPIKEEVEKLVIQPRRSLCTIL